MSKIINKHLFKVFMVASMLTTSLSGCEKVSKSISSKIESTSEACLEINSSTKEADKMVIKYGGRTFTMCDSEIGFDEEELKHLTKIIERAEATDGTFEINNVDNYPCAGSKCVRDGDIILIATCGEGCSDTYICTFLKSIDGGNKYTVNLNYSSRHLNKKDVFE